MSPGNRIADAANLRTASDNVDYPFQSGLRGFIHSVFAIRDGVLPLISKEILEMTSFEELSYL